MTEHPQHFPVSFNATAVAATVAAAGSLRRVTRLTLDIGDTTAGVTVTVQVLSASTVIDQITVDSTTKHVSRESNAVAKSTEALRYSRTVTGAPAASSVFFAMDYRNG